MWERVRGQGGANRARSEKRSKYVYTFASPFQEDRITSSRQVDRKLTLVYDACTPRTDDLYDLYDLFPLQLMIQVFQGIYIFLICMICMICMIYLMSQDRFSWVGSVLYRSCTTSHNGRLGYKQTVQMIQMVICLICLICLMCLICPTCVAYL